MNYIMPVIENDYEELNKKAKKLGFQIISNNPGKFLHPDFKSEIFDFTATNPNKLLLAVFNQGKRWGCKYAYDDVRSYIDIRNYINK